MTPESYNLIYLAGGGGGGESDLKAFAGRIGYPVRFEIIRYPGWQRYLEDGFSIDSLVEELAAEIIERVPTGPIRIMGMSIGGHLGYAAALRLQKRGRKVAVFLAIDSFALSTQAAAGWQKRALSDALELLRKGRLKEFAKLVRSKAWRMVLRLAGGRLAGILRRLFGGNLPPIFSGDALAEQELSMRLLVREAATWFEKLDCNPEALLVPAILLRTQNSAPHDAIWRRRCPDIAIREVPGKHATLFERENVGAFCDAFCSALATQNPEDYAKLTELETAAGKTA